MKIIVLFALSAFSALASGAGSAPAALDPLSAETLWRVFGSLGAILITIFALVWLLRRSGNLVRGRAGKMQVVDILSLGQRERLVLVSIADKQIVLGVAPGLVQALHTLDSPYVETSEAGVSKFSELLRRANTNQNTAVSETSKDE